MLPVTLTHVSHAHGVHHLDELLRRQFAEEVIVGVDDRKAGPLGHVRGHLQQALGTVVFQEHVFHGKIALIPVILAEVDQVVVQLLAVAEAGVFVGPVFEHLVDVAMGRDEAVRPERNAAFELPGLELVGGRLEDRAPRDDHRELAVDPPQPGQHALARPCRPA